MTGLRVCLRTGTEHTTRRQYVVEQFISHEGEIVAVLNDTKGTLTYANIATLRTIP